MTNTALDRTETAPEPISDLHNALSHVERQYTAFDINRIVNHADVLPWVSGSAEGALDLTSAVANPANVCLVGELGTMLFVAQQPGLYECHVATLPDGRGAWTERFVRACLHWIFTRTDAVEIMARLPKGNVRVRALATRVGFKPEFTVEQGWALRGRIVPAEIRSLKLTDWLRDAPGLEERGAWFRDRLAEGFARHNASLPTPHTDPLHDRAMGMVSEMIFGGMTAKASIFYHRMAAFAGWAPIGILTHNSIDIGSAILIFRDDGEMWVATVKKGTN